MDSETGALDPSFITATRYLSCVRTLLVAARMSSKPDSPFSQIDLASGMISEGKAKIKFPKGEVFYNPVQQFNRDLTILVLKSFHEQYKVAKKGEPKGLRILEALSATGLRAIRYARELDCVESIVANDLDPNAVELIKSNVELNSAEDENVKKLVEPHQGDANGTMHKYHALGKSFDVIDLDPYGSASPFMDAAVQTVADGGLLCVTCTDLAVLCASYPETCFAKYGGLPVKGESCHEAVWTLFLSTDYL